MPFLLHGQISSISAACTQILEAAGVEETSKHREASVTSVSLPPLALGLCLMTLPYLFKDQKRESKDPPQQWILLT